MRVLIDTSAWSVALRRQTTAPRPPVAAQIEAIIRDGRAVIIGPIRQELLSGIRDPHQFEALRNHLRAFPDLSIAQADHELAAEVSNLCRRKGIQGSGVDLLICAVAIRAELAILTTDQDFKRYATVVDLRILPVEATV